MLIGQYKKDWSIRNTSLSTMRFITLRGITMIKLPFHLRLAAKTYDLMQRQERYGVLFDQEAARKLVVYIDQEMQKIKEDVEPKLPSRPLNKTENKEWTPPVRQFKADGTPSAFTEKWFDSVNSIRDPDTGDVTYTGKKADIVVALPYHEPIIDSLPMQLKNQAQIKDWLMSLGWKPTLWNFKKDKKGKPVRDENNQLIKTSPKFHEQGRICENLEKLGDKVELVKPIIAWLSLRNRRSVLINEEKGTGWLNHPRLKVDGRLPASSSGLTNTKRQKHKVVANVPRVTSLLGPEFRASFIAPEDKVFVGYDASGLEARNEASRSYPYDGGNYAAEILEGDIHAKNAEVFGTDRDGAKSPKYAITYGCSAPKLAGLLDIPTQRAKELIDDYWQSNYAIARHKEALEKEWKESGKKYITGIAGDKIVVRSPHSLLNCDLQNMGAKIMDLAGWYMDKWIKHYNIPAKRVVYYHDEYIFECNPEDAGRVAELGIQSIKKAGEYFKLNVPLDADAKIGKSWADVH
jgi:hypothetical protein